MQNQFEMPHHITFGVGGERQDETLKNRIDQNRRSVCGRLLHSLTTSLYFLRLRKWGIFDSVLFPLHEGGREKRREEGEDHLCGSVAHPHGPGVALGNLLRRQIFRFKIDTELFVLIPFFKFVTRVVKKLIPR